MFSVTWRRAWCVAARGQIVFLKAQLKVEQTRERELNVSVADVERRSAVEKKNRDELLIVVKKNNEDLREELATKDAYAAVLQRYVWLVRGC
jgi:hypothetical protein